MENAWTNRTATSRGRPPSSERARLDVVPVHDCLGGGLEIHILVHTSRGDALDERISSVARV